MPSDSPTVPIADAVSNKHGISGRLSMRLIIVPQPMNRITYIMNIVAAFRTTSSGMRLLYKSACSFLLKTEKADDIKTAIVVVFIPPAVEPGEPPIIINEITSICPASLNAVKSVVLNPAVLGVID